ncbi:MAG TPA: general secretion pathway protein GspK [Stenotrophomonas sp.]|jgi:general secretion pathway protein K|uniref:Type II secretion system protein K n=2 Tax=Stenotrophomonas TaxID=40323 RepID=A0A4S2D4V5_STEMA|nr:MULTISPECIES: type II secretion system protein GspK [Stenotrophomonas]MBD3825382.1 general secretion pathway protein GspK [Stenotrophomonas sp.]QIO86900.1 general secretion pathway protein GspK [Stenotrophomonas rhizophila]TGY35901.1 general secretion pathway protein GspK [Stenotrophomonas maltophilia]HBS61797.1 general secretion pathway protein GspK [Stenotrophomonas sp.]
MTRRMRGAALVLVLWLIALLTAVVGAYALTARVEHLQQRVVGDDAIGQEHARAGLEYALHRLQPTATQPAWVPDGRRYRWQFDERRIDLRIVDENGKINLNLADAALLSGFLRALGEPPPRAQQLAGAILDWRDADNLKQPGGGAETADYRAAGLPYGARNARFDSLGELQRVLGMDAALYARMEPMLTLYSRQSRPDPRFAAGPVLSALGLDAERLLAERERAQAAVEAGVPVAPLASGGGTYSIESRATDARGRVSVLRAVVRMGSAGTPGRVYTVFRWEQGMAAR